MIHRRRQALNVWPALADLMTVLAVPALSTALGLFPLLGRVNGTQVARAEPAGELSPARESLQKLFEQSPRLFEPQPGLALRVIQSNPARFEVAESQFARDSGETAAIQTLCQQLCPLISSLSTSPSLLVELNGRYATEEGTGASCRTANERTRRVTELVLQEEACRDCRWHYRVCEHRVETLPPSQGRPQVELFVIPDWRQIPSTSGAP